MQKLKERFIDLAPELQILNADDPIGAEWLNELPNGIASQLSLRFPTNI